MKNTILKELKFFLIIALAGQILFALVSRDFTTPSYEGRIYATTSVKHRQEDLHKLNEAAHYFGQTMIGWLKFPNFMKDLTSAVSLPVEATMTAHIQERQNIIFTVHTSTPVSLEALGEVKNYLQSKMNEYNAVSQTEFVLSNLDYEQTELKRSYLSGAFITLILTVIISLGILFIRREFQ